jgi:uncharacterized membrane protein
VSPTDPSATLVERCGWSLVWVGVLVAGLGFWGSWSGWTWAALLAPLLVLAGIAGTLAVWVVRDPGARAMHAAGLAGALVAVAVPQAAGIHVRQFYTTDSAAFDQVAARALLHGHDPYTTSMAPAAALLKSPWEYWTYTAGGGHVTHASYPAGSFLLEWAAMAVGFHHQVTDWVDLAAWLVTAVLLYLLLPVALRWVALLVLLTPLFTAMFANGGTDALFLPFLVLAVWRWDRFGTGRGAGLASWIGPVALGLACAVKQTPWFCVPFLVVGVWLEARRRGAGPWRVAGRYAGIVAAVFVAVDLPFIVWSPAAWADGTLLPFAQPLVADGQGLVTLAIHGLTGGVVLSLLTVAGLLAYLALLAAFAVWFPRLKRVWLLALPLALFVPARSLSTYLLDLVPAALVAAVTVAAPALPGAPTGRRRWPGWAAVGVPLVAAAAVAVVAFTSAPLALSVRGFRTSDATQRLDAVTVVVHNGTGHPVTPHFMVVISGSHPTGFWRSTTGRPVVVGAGATATVTLEPAEYTWSPVRGGYWMVEAYTTAPNALSTSRLQFWPFGEPQF